MKVGCDYRSKLDETFRPIELLQLIIAFCFMIGMDRLFNLAQLWDWLPAFRVVGEYQHLPSAASELHISASALSRSVRMLEEQLGAELFDRVGRTIALNDRGHELLRSLRRAMRLLDDSIATLSSSAMFGPLRVSAVGALESLFAQPALLTLLKTHPRLAPEIVPLPEIEVNAALLAGKIDLALLEAPQATPEIELERLGLLDYSVYCGVRHPLFLVEKPSLDQITSHGFVTPARGQFDPWPLDIRRGVALRLSQFQSIVTLCVDGTYLAVLPARAALPYVARGQLKRLPTKCLLRRHWFAAFRQQLRPDSKERSLLEVLRRQNRVRKQP